MGIALNELTNVAKHFIETAVKALRPGGRLMLGFVPKPSQSPFAQRKQRGTHPFALGRVETHGAMPTRLNESRPCSFNSEGIAPRVMS